jgi:hypothetical protein
MSNDRDDVGKSPKTPQDKPTKKPNDKISDEDLGKVSGGAGRPNLERFREDSGNPIPGPSWVNLMAYRKAGWGADAPRWRSASEVFEELATEPADKEE